jgi:hypothetical protein
LLRDVSGFEMKGISLDMKGHFDGRVISGGGGSDEGVTGTGNWSSNRIADAHCEGAVRAEVPPGTDASFGGVFGDPTTDGRVFRGTFAFGRDTEYSKQPKENEGAN